MEDMKENFVDHYGTVKCPICEEPYIMYMFYDGDQSACHDCRKKAERKGSKTVISDSIGINIQVPQWIIDHNSDPANH